MMKKITKQLLVTGFCLPLATISFVITAAKPDKPGKPPVNPPAESTIIDEIQAELDYIVNSTYTEENKNSKTWRFLQSSDDIFGAINVQRIVPRRTPAGTSWIRPGEAAMAVVGMMQGIDYLADNGESINTYDSVIDKFFLSWILAHEQGQNNDVSSADHGAFMDRTYYNADGSYAYKVPTWKTDVTAQIMIANWKYYEYNVNTGQTDQAADWINSAWSVQQKAADYLVRMHDTTPAGAIHMLPGNSNESEYGTWIHFAANAVPALRSASAWAQKVSVSSSDYDRVANDLIIGIQTMKDTSHPNYYKYRPYLGNGQYGDPTYGDSIDQLTFSPYETGAISVDAFAKQISDWWTNGDAEIKMTYETTDPSDWRYFGTHWHYYFNGDPSENNYLYPGPGFQLAKVEWKHGNAFNDTISIDRSNNRLTWAKSTDYSSLWWFKTKDEEARVPNGFQDWRNALNYSETAEDWARFTDTSAYFIELLLMNEAGIDTDYNPILQ
ncbi:MAG: hypothetical protein KAS07_04265 [Candidatus Pacebacteria bacterium]|nr:hypothetical protein [Candidatus Paceibacterota bacterium]